MSDELDINELQEFGACPEESLDDVIALTLAGMDKGTIPFEVGMKILNPIFDQMESIGVMVARLRADPASLKTIMRERGLL